MTDVETRVVRRRKPRKSRSRGLRTTAGCLMCKQRHVKCDEVRPQCGPCRKGQRQCAYETADLQSKRLQRKQQQPQPFQETMVHDHHPTDDGQNVVPATSVQSPVITRDAKFQLPGPDSPLSYRTSGISPGTDISSGHAPYSWFELLATDVANIDHTFLLSPSTDPNALAITQPVEDGGSPTNPFLIPRNLREKQSFQAAAFENISVAADSRMPTVEAPAVVTDDRSCWTLPAQIQLNSVEASIFSHFITQLSSWLDFFDPLKHFGTLIPHLALYNIGLMKALLALSARNVSLCEAKELAELSQVVSGNDGNDVEGRKTFREMSVQFYYETLQYLHKAMHYKSYTRSQELLATAILISTYEMMDGSNQDWERHLKGVFWIQRSQDNDGESGGLRQAVWWTWLQQDIWVALLERRRVFSFWHPKRPIATLTSPEIACRAVYLLAQCINYASNEEREGNTIEHRAQKGNGLYQMLEDWAHHLPPEFSTLPVAQQSQDAIFPPIWVHPPSYAAAVQLHYLSKILVLLHRPLSGGPLDYSIVQRTIRKAVDIVCGIARTVDRNSTAANYISVLCLFVAGTTLHFTQERALVLELINTCERRISWSSRSLRMELESEWRKIDGGENSFGGGSF